MRYAAVDQAIRSGKLWRAKEILQGRLSSPDFDRELLSRYGQVLQSMGDHREAGRFLFCAGVRNPEHLEAIRLFLSKQPRTEPENFLATMPAMVRRQRHLAAYLASADFEKLGWSKEALQSVKTVSGTAPPERAESFSSRIRSWLGIGFIAFTFVSIPVGMFTIIRFVVSGFR